MGTKKRLALFWRSIKRLNESDTDAVMKLYASDGVFMLQNSPSSIGSGAVRKAYEAVFGAITLSVKFEIAEIRQIAPDLPAVVRAL